MTTPKAACMRNRNNCTSSSTRGINRLEFGVSTNYLFERKNKQTNKREKPTEKTKKKNTKQNRTKQTISEPNAFLLDFNHQSQWEGSFAYYN